MPAVDPFADFGRNPHGAFDHAAAVTPSDSADLPIAASCLMCVQGDVKVTTLFGEVVTMKATNWVPLRVARVWATGTTATSIVALW